MKTLRLICHCGKGKLFRAEDVKGIIAAINASDWDERVWIDAPGLRQGMGFGACPEHADLEQHPDPRCRN